MMLKEGGIGAYQKPENRPKFPSKPKNQKKKNAQNRKTGENNDPNREFIFFNPSPSDTIAKYRFCIRQVDVK